MDSAKVVPGSLPPCRLNVAAIATGARHKLDNHLSITVFAAGMGESTGTVEVLVVHVIPEAAAFTGDVVNTVGNDKILLVGRSQETPVTDVGSSTRGKADDSGGGSCENCSLHSDDLVREKRWEV